MSTPRLMASLVAAATCLSTLIPAASAAETYVVDPAHTSILFGVSHAGFSYTYGFFRKAEGSYIIDKTNPANCRFRFTIQTASLDTNHTERDTHLKSPDFFNAQQFPTITFESTSCTTANTPDGSIVYNVTGNLTIHGVTQRVTIPLRMLGEGQGPFKDFRTGFLSNFTLKRTDYGMNNLLENNMVGDAIAITVSFEGSLQQPAATPAR